MTAKMREGWTPSKNQTGSLKRERLKSYVLNWDLRHRTVLPHRVIELEVFKMSLSSTAELRTVCGCIRWFSGLFLTNLILGSRRMAFLKQDKISFHLQLLNEFPHGLQSTTAHDCHRRFSSSIQTIVFPAFRHHFKKMQSSSIEKHYLYVKALLNRVLGFYFCIGFSFFWSCFPSRQ